MNRETKEFTARLYESPIFDQALGDALHPGGLKLTARIAEVARIKANSRVLDIASGKGTSALFLSQRYGCRVVGIDLSPKSISLGESKVETEKLRDRVQFIVGDAESLPFEDSTFDAAISECSFSLLPNKGIAAKEIKRILRSGGRLAMSDVFLRGRIRQDLRTQAAFAWCIAGAEPVEGYIKLFTAVGFEEPYFEDHSLELKRAGYQILVGCGSLETFLTQFGEGMAEGGSQAVASEIWKRVFREAKPGYGLFAFIRP